MKKIEVDKLPKTPNECPYATLARNTVWVCDLANGQKICTKTVGANCCFLVEKESE